MFIIHGISMQAIFIIIVTISDLWRSISFRYFSERRNANSHIIFKLSLQLQDQKEERNKIGEHISTGKAYR